MGRDAKPDRFATLKRYFEAAGDHDVDGAFERIRETTVDEIRCDFAACLALVAFWTYCDGKTTKATMTVTGLAKKLSCTRDTASRAIRALVALGLVRPAARHDGREIPGRWTVSHVDRPSNIG